MRAFRGVPGEMTVDFGSGQSVAVYGENGTGKSTIADALEWYFTGQIELLSHEGRQHAVRHLGGDGDGATSVEVVTSGALGGAVTFPDERKPEAIGSTGRETFLLRGRTLADFINKTKTEKWKAVADILGLDAIEGLREDLQRVRNELRREAKAAHEELEACRRALGSATGELTEETVLANLREICGLLGVEPPVSLDQVADPLWIATVAGGKAGGAGPAPSSLAGEIERLPAVEIDRRAIDAWNDLVSSDGARALPRASLVQEASRLLGRHPLDGRCPLCGQAVDERKLARRIEDVLRELQGAQQELEARREAVARPAAGLTAAHDRRQSLVTRGRALGIELPPVPPLPATSFSDALAGLAPIDPGPLAGFASAIQEWDQTALRLGREGADAPASTRESQLVMLATLCQHIRTWRQADTKAARAARARGLAEAVFDAYQSRQKDDLAKLLAQISRRVAEIYTALHPGEELGAVSIEPWTAKGVELAIEFYGSRQRPPHGVLSESHLNSLAIALFLAMAETFNERLGFLVLDDVINSFDLEHRAQLADLLADQFGDWQLVVLTHDHQFFEHLTRRAPSWKRLELTSWSYRDGPRTVQYEGRGLLGAARERLSGGDVQGAAAKARRALEEQLQEACQALEAPLAFRRGQANERREIGELLRGLRRALKEHAKGMLDRLDPLLKDLEADVQATLNVEVHASRGRSGSAEVEAALARIEELDRGWSCPACGTRIWHKGGPAAGRCRCGKSAFPPLPSG
jgi:energy-coupling factor transporter ATP-binding protein EcfA2